jgi:hypothetical protein
MRIAITLIACTLVACGGPVTTGDAEPDPVEEIDVLDDPVAEFEPDPIGDPVDEELPVDPTTPLFDDVGLYETTIAASGDPAHVHYPDPPDLSTGGYRFPIVLLLQGAKVDREHYSGFAGIVASYGFIVVVPNHEAMTVTGRGLYAEQSEVNDVLAHMKAEHEDPASPLFGVVHTGLMALLGHSYGGVAGLSAIRGVCQMPFCTGGFTRPPELRGGAFWGTNLAMPVIGTVPAIENDGRAVALVQGTLDSMATPDDALTTYEKIQTPPRALIEVTGANHYGVCNTNNPSGADPDSSTPTLDQSVSVETIARWSALFLRAHILDDTAALQWVHVTGDGEDDNAVVSRQSL